MTYEEAKQVLGLSSPYSEEDIDRAFREAASRLHPDKGGSDELMAEAISARDLLHDQTRAKELPAVIAQFEVTLREANAVAAEHRAIEKAADRTEEAVRSHATGRLRSWKQLAYIATGVAAAALFLAKEIPRELFGFEASETLSTPAEVKRPSKPGSLTQLNWDDALLSEEANKSLSEDEREEYRNYQVEFERFNEYQKQLSSITMENSMRREHERKYNQMFYLSTFAFVLYSGLLAWILNRKIQHVELELSDLNDRLKIREDYIGLLSKLFDGVPENWSKASLSEKIKESSELSRVAKAGLGVEKLSSLVLLKGQESGFVRLEKGTRANGYRDTYHLVE